MREVILPSGAKLQIGLSPFATAKGLYQAILKEVRTVEIKSSMEMANLYKEIFCVGFGTPEIEMWLWKCFERCTYEPVGGAALKIDKDTFEPASAREDYMTASMEVAKENVLPFVKSLYAEYLRVSSMIDDIQKSKSTMTT